MKIYLSHSTQFPYQEELYAPVRASELNEQHEIILPHESSKDPRDFVTREIVPDCDLVIAEVSHAATGQGIELGWADAAGVPILAFHREGTTPSKSVQVIAEDVVDYQDVSELIEILMKTLEDVQSEEPAEPYNKLVRDRIPEIIAENGQQVEVEELDEEGFRFALGGKLHEEVHEYLEDESPEELADILEVVYALGETHGKTSTDLETMRAQKAEERGRFTKKLYLKSVK